MGPGAAAALLLAVVSTAHAQHGSIKGIVTDGTRPLDNATVEVFGLKQNRLTPASGAFSFDSLKPGPYWLRVRRIGHHPVTVSTTLGANDTKDFTVELDAAAYRMPEVLVSGGMTSQRYSDFRWRQRSSLGRFYTRDDIARLRPGDLASLVQRSLPWISRYMLEQRNWPAPGREFGYVSHVSGRSDFGSRSRLNIRTRNCTPAVSRNGAAPWPGNSLLDYPLEDVEAVEVYRGSHIPIIYQGVESSGCGLVVVWLR
jgi:hypothetical protein